MLKEFYTLWLKLSRSIVLMGWLSSGEGQGKNPGYKQPEPASVQGVLLKIEVIRNVQRTDWWSIACSPTRSLFTCG